MGNLESILSERIVSDARKRTKTHVENWWICRRTLRWPKPLRDRFFDVLAMTPRVLQALPPFDSCRTCIRGAPQLRRTWLYVHLEDSFRWRFEVIPVVDALETSGSR